MVCPACGTQRPDDASRCPVCGTGADAVTEAPTILSAPATSPPPRRSSESGSGSDIDHGAFTPGTVLAARYRIVGLLGRGGMGEVYRADDLTLGQPVGLKFLHAGAGERDAVVARLRDETRTARQVSHPNVCRVHDVGEWQGRPFVSMEYVDGEDLASLLRRIGRLQPDKAIDIVRQVCAGLAAAHDRGVLHRDLKPANVMLDGRGKVRITDFGLASFTDEDHAGQIAGTPAYMAPEQVMGGNLSPQTDIYAVGLLLFELLTGKAAYDGVTLSERRQRTPPTPALPSSVRSAIDRQIVDVLERCLDPDPLRRPSSALAVAAALPGGDPLVAALAAGETPAPHVVAAAAGSGGLSTAQAVVLFAAFVVGVVTQLTVFGSQAYSRYVPFRHSPEVLAARAEEIRHRLGYDDLPADSVRGFTTRTGYLAWRRARSTGPYHWEHLRFVRPQPVQFWYRSSGQPLLTPVAARLGIGQAMLAASSPEPPGPSAVQLPSAGGSYIELDPDGALSALTVVPLEDANAPAAASVDWTTLFTEARLDPAAFARLDAAPRTPVPADTRAAWSGPAPDGSGTELRIEAAALAGRPVYFRIVAPWTTSRAAAGVPIETVLFTLLFFALFVIGAVLARVNLQEGRTDRHGALRVAASVGLVMFAAQMLEAHHVASGEEAFVIIGALSWALFVAAFSWLSYVALEPYVRRHWPHALIGWTRLVAARWRDPQVGRDLLVGSALGLAAVFIDRGIAVLVAMRSGSDVIWVVDVEALGSLGAMGAAFLRTVAVSAAFPIDLLFLLLLLRVFLPRPWLSPVLATVILVGLTTPTMSDPILQLPLVTLSVAISVIALTRYGLLAGCAEMFVEVMSTHVLSSFDISQFYARTMLVGLFLFALPAIVGFYGSIAGRSLVSRRFALSQGVS